MKTLQTLTDNPFFLGLSEASRPNIANFLNTTCNRVAAKNPGGIYDEILAGLILDRDGFDTGFNEASLGTQKSATMTIEGTLETMVTTGRKLYNKIEDAFGLKSPKLMEFFPKGLMGITRAKRGDIKNILTTWADKAAIYNKELGGDWVTALTDLQTNWNAVQDNQDKAKTDVSGGRQAISNNTDGIAKNLWSLLLQVCKNNLEDPLSAANLYFDLSPLMHSENHDNDGVGRVLGIAKDVDGNPTGAIDIVVKNFNGVEVWKGKTKNNGSFRTKNLPIGMCTFTFAKQGFIDQTISQEIFDDKDASIDVVMLMGY
jgi:hypothetical protein